MKNILITGGLGYIGGRLATYLNEKEPDANILLTTSNKTRKLPAWTNKFTVLQMNVNDERSIKNSLKDINIIVHLAALNEIDSIKDPELALEINTKGVYNQRLGQRELDSLALGSYTRHLNFSRWE